MTVRRFIRQALRPGRSTVPYSPHSQSNESAILQELTAQADAPATFVEFGFGVHEFNCSGLLGTSNGLLVDGDAATVEQARQVLPRSVEARCRFLDLPGLEFVLDRFVPGSLGVLSIDVDGNDYWFLQKLLRLRPAVVAVEYNASMGLRPLAVPYDPAFERHEKHPSGWYHGASLAALEVLCGEHGYGLVRTSDGGVNAFFITSESAEAARIPVVSAADAYRENLLRNQWSGTSAGEQWEVIRHLPFECVDQAPQPPDERAAP